MFHYTVELSRINISLSASFFFFFLAFYLPSSSGSLTLLDVKEASGISSSTTVLCDVSESSEVASDRLLALVPGRGSPNFIREGNFSEEGVCTITGVGLDVLLGGAGWYL